MKKFVACLLFAAMVNITDSNAQTDDAKAKLNLGVNLAPQMVYQFGAEKPSGNLGIFFAAGLSTKSAGVTGFYGSGHNLGLFIYKNTSPKTALYSVYLNNLHNTGQYIGAGAMHGLGSVGEWFSASAFVEAGIPFGQEKQDPIICAGLFLGFSKLIKKW